MTALNARVVRWKCPPPYLNLLTPSPRLRVPVRRAERRSSMLAPAARAEEHASHMKLLENALKVRAAPLVARARAQLSPRAAAACAAGCEEPARGAVSSIGRHPAAGACANAAASHVQLASPPAQHAHAHVARACAPCAGGSAPVAAGPAKSCGGVAGGGRVGGWMGAELHCVRRTVKRPAGTPLVWHAAS